MKAAGKKLGKVSLIEAWQARAGARDGLEGGRGVGGR